MSLPAIWIPDGVRKTIVLEAKRRSPKETGGLLLGYWVGATMSIAVVTEAVGAGPGAVNEMDRFVPDHDYQAHEVHRLSVESGKRLWYLGDWHTHPSESSVILSSTDKRTLRTIADADDAFAPKPIMVVLAGRADWKPSGWQGQYVKRRWRRRRFVVSELPILTYS